MPRDCLFCQLVRDGEHVATADGFVAIRDINPQAETHLLVLPERHVDTFREVGEFAPDEAKRMLEFVARDGARGRARGLPRARQRRPRRRPDDLPPALARPRWEESAGCRHEPASSLIERSELSSTTRCASATTRAATRCALILSSLRGAEKELQRPLSRGRGAAGAAARAEEAGRGGRGVPRRRPRGAGRGGGGGARRARGVHARAALARRSSRRSSTT